MKRHSNETEKYSDFQKHLEASYNGGPRVEATTEVLMLDYVLKGIQGLQMDSFVPGSYRCVNLTKYTQIDVMRMITRI